ncbi:MAG TPA: glycosyltransferase family 2 protein [Candidatus Limnocylindria bacterium]|nr:glycosyltransferase family 2 protein [Candidatus Limnocylindria bacterium]
MTPGLSVVIITHNSRERILALLESLASDPASEGWETVVLDNGSVDGTAAAVRERCPEVRVTENRPQRGFAGALNQGVAMTSAPAIVTVNPDAIVPTGSMGRLLRVLEQEPRIAAVGPLIRFPDGRVQRHGMYDPRPLTAAVVLLGLARLPMFRAEAERYYGRHEPGPPADVDSLTGACLMFRRVAYREVGPFDERFFLYCEDVDWSLRARSAGWRLVFVPDVHVVHEKATASRQQSSFVIRHYYRSLRAFYGKHHAPRQLAPLRAAWYAASYLLEGTTLVTDAIRADKGLRY